MEGAMLSLVVEVVSPIIGKLIGKLSASYLGDDVTFKEIKKLYTVILPQIQIAIKATEEIPIDKLKPWLMDLKAAAFEAEDVLDLYEYKVIENKVTSDYNPLQKLKAKTKEFIADMLPKTKLKKSLEKLKQSANEAKDMFPFINVIRQHAPQQDTKSQHSTTTVSGMSSPIFGRDGERDNIINMLINEAGSKSTCSRTSIPVLVVLGIGGAGKTTFTQAVYNDSEVKSHFDMRMWVHVSRNFDVHRVTTHIIESAGQDRSTCSTISNLDALQKMLEGILNSKKFLLVLDDIWCEDKGEWDKLLIPLNNVGDNGSRILITTRTEVVALTLGIENKNLIPLKELKVEDCLSILKHYAFCDTRQTIEDRALADVAVRISYKLKNSPLAARLVGSSLRRRVDVDAWEMILKQDMLSDTLNCVLLSFQFLPPHLQRCFAFCSLFPKGQRFHTGVINDLVQIWIAEGFVEALEDNELTTVEKGRQYFNELVSYSFFQSHPNYPSTYVIHDLLHDLAEKVSKDHCFRIEADGPEVMPTTTVHLSIVHLSMMEMAGLPTMPFPDISVLVNLRTLMCIDSHIDNSLLDICTKLRVLYCMPCYYLPPSIMPKLPRSIGQLKHLRYLQAERVEQLPDSFGRLYHLQFLHLPNHKIEKAPKSFSNLVNLQCMLPANHLRIKIPEIGKLTSLQTLESYRVETSREFGIGQLKNLNQLGGSLEIEGLENVKDMTEATEARLNQKKHLEKLSLRWNSSISRDGRVDEEVLEGMEPHSNLKKLGIRGYRGAETPSWMRHILPGLQSLWLIHCPNLTGVPHLPDSLNTLTVWDCPELKQLSPFPRSLENLSIFNSSGFEDLFSIFISFNDDDDEEKEKQWSLHQQNCGLFQPFALKELSIVGCSVLRGETFNLFLRKFDLLSRLEFGGLSKLTSLLLGPNLKHLCNIVIKNCENLQSLEGIGALPHLQELSLDDLPELAGMGNLQALTSIYDLNVSKCPKLTTGVGAYQERAIAHRLHKWCGLRRNLVKIDDPMLLAVLLEKQGLNSVDRLEIVGCSQDRPFNTEEDDMFLQLTSIKCLEFFQCEKLPSLPANLQKLPSLETLKIRDCRQMESLPNFPTSLTQLEIWSCPKMESLPNLPTSLNELEIWSCPKMESLPNLPTSLNELKIRNCPEMESLPNLPTSLTQLVIGSCPKIESLPNLPTSLNVLGIGKCPKMEPLPNLPTSLNELRIYECPKMESLPNLPTSLNVLGIGRCPKMESLPNLPTSLIKLRIDECPKMESLPYLPTSLNKLKMLGCPKLKDKYGEGGPLHHKLSHIPEIYIA